MDITKAFNAIREALRSKERSTLNLVEIRQRTSCKSDIERQTNTVLLQQHTTRVQTYTKAQETLNALEVLLK